MPVVTLRVIRTQPVPEDSVNATTDSKETASLTAGLRILVRTVSIPVLIVHQLLMFKFLKSFNSSGSTLFCDLFTCTNGGVSFAF